MACKLCEDTGKKTCPTCKGKGRHEYRTGSGWAVTDCGICHASGRVECECQVVPRVFIRIVAIHGRDERVVTEEEVPEPVDNAWLPDIRLASHRVVDKLTRIIQSTRAWWVEQV